jgi:hypothetical protein
VIWITLVCMRVPLFANNRFMFQTIVAPGDLKSQAGTPAARRDGRRPAHDTVLKQRPKCGDQSIRATILPKPTAAAVASIGGRS